MTCNPKVKDPSAKLDYGFEWNDGYLESGSPPETIATSVWSFEPAQGSPAEITFVTGTDTISVNGFETAVAVEGGIAGNRYRLTNEITTSLGRRDQRSIEIRVANQ